MATAVVLGRVALSGARLPFYASRISAGFPSPADDYAETELSLDELTNVRAPSTYLVRVIGDSMIGRGIFDGDVLVVDRAREAKVTNVVIAYVEGGFTVKALAYEGTQPVLRAANRGYLPIRFCEGEVLEVWGVATHNLHGLLDL